MRWIIGALAIGLFASQTPQPSRPTITKVQPPHWWTPTNWRDVLLLCDGNNLRDAKVASLSPDLAVTKVSSSEDGRYLFVWLRLAPKATPRPHRLIVRTPEGEINIAFPLRPRPPQTVLGKGLTENELIYLLMPDRFCDGDPANNDPHGLKTYDRTNPAPITVAT
jgi:neopullulanase